MTNMATDCTFQYTMTLMIDADRFRLIREAADGVGVSVEDFVIRAAIMEAQDLLDGLIKEG